MNTNMLATAAKLSDEALIERLKVLAGRAREAMAELIAYLSELAAPDAFVGRNALRCSERTFLEFHHVRPHAWRGEPTVDNISLRCRAHNVYESEMIFGRFDPLVVRETRAEYATNAVPMPPTCPGTSSNRTQVGGA